MITLQKKLIEFEQKLLRKNGLNDCKKEEIGHKRVVEQREEACVQKDKPSEEHNCSCRGRKETWSRHL